MINPERTAFCEAFTHSHEMNHLLQGGKDFRSELHSILMPPFISHFTLNFK